MFNKRMLVFMGIRNCVTHALQEQFSGQIYKDIIEIGAVPLNTTLVEEGNPEYFRDLAANMLLGCDVVIWTDFEEAFDPFYRDLAVRNGKPIVGSLEELRGFHKSWMRENGIPGYPEIPIHQEKENVPTQQPPQLEELFARLNKIPRAQRKHPFFGVICSLLGKRPEEIPYESGNDRPMSKQEAFSSAPNSCTENH